MVTGGNRDERSNAVPRDPRQGGGAAGGSIHGALERARRRRAPADDRRALDGGRITDPPAAPGDARDRREPRHRAGVRVRGAGNSELQARATTSYEHWVGSERLSFRARDDAQRLGDVVKFHWEAVADDGSTAAVGLNVLVLAADGRIQRNCTFVDGA
jgi:hypothetical protein